MAPKRRAPLRAAVRRGAVGSAGVSGAAGMGTGISSGRTGCIRLLLLFASALFLFWALSLQLDTLPLPSLRSRSGLQAERESDQLVFGGSGGGEGGRGGGGEESVSSSPGFGRMLAGGLGDFEEGTGRAPKKQDRDQRGKKKGKGGGKGHGGGAEQSKGGKGTTEAAKGLDGGAANAKPGKQPVAAKGAKGAPAGGKVATAKAAAAGAGTSPPKAAVAVKQQGRGDGRDQGGKAAAVLTSPPTKAVAAAAKQVPPPATRPAAQKKTGFWGRKGDANDKAAAGTAVTSATKQASGGAIKQVVQSLDKVATGASRGRDGGASSRSSTASGRRFLLTSTTFRASRRRPPRPQPIDFDVNVRTLRAVHLDAHRFAPQAPPKGPQCPQFEYGYVGFDGVASCWRAPLEDPEAVPSHPPANCLRRQLRTCQNKTDRLPHDAWAAQVLLLHNVYINVAGQVFNKTHYFDHNSCIGDSPFVHRAGSTPVHRFPQLVSLVDWHGWNSRSVLLNILPLLVSLDGVLPLVKSGAAPVAFGHRSTHVNSQLKQMMNLGVGEVLGVDLAELSPKVLKEGELFFAENLFLPLQQQCGRSSPALWSYLRTRHLLPKGGLPMYSGGASFIPTYKVPAKPPPELSGTGPDWVVLIGMKDPAQVRGKQLVEALKLRSHLLRYLPEQHVDYYQEGRLGVAQRKLLLNRARLLVSVQQSLLADMVFMPPGGIVFELRPVDQPDPTFHQLAEACGLEYHLMFTHGQRATHGHLSVDDPSAIHKHIRVLAKKVLNLGK